MRYLTLSLVAITFVATVGLGWLFDRVYEQYNRVNKTDDISAIQAIENFGIDLADTLNKLPDKHNFILNWPKHSQYRLTLKPFDSLLLPNKLLKKVKQGKPLLLETNNNLAFHFYIDSTDELLIIKSPIIAVTRPDNYIFTVVFYIALLLLFSVWLIPLIRRLIILRTSAKSFGEGQLSQRIGIKSFSYIRDIEIEFNYMAQRIENLISDVKLLSSAVSHDLRTPLSRIRFGIDTLQEEDDPDVRRRFEEKISDNVDEMTALVETLLNYSRLEQAMLTLNKGNVDISQIISNCVEIKTINNKIISFEKVKGESLVKGDAIYLGMLVNNLIKNAQQYCLSTIKIELRVEKDNIVLIISDDGRGIELTQRDDILKPFVRGTFHQEKNTQEQQKIKGYGIGLAIVKRIVDWHNGSISICNSDDLGGAEFTVILPKVSS